MNNVFFFFLAIYRAVQTIDRRVGSRERVSGGRKRDLQYRLWREEEAKHDLAARVLLPAPASGTLFPAYCLKVYPRQRRFEQRLVERQQSLPDPLGG